MLKTILIGLFGALVTLVTGTIIAIAMQPYIAPQMIGMIRTEEQGLLFPSLVSGYLIIGLVGAFLLQETELYRKEISRQMASFLLIGLAIFLGDHLITAGWSQLPVVPMAISGVLDSFSVLAGLLAMSVIYRKQMSTRVA